MKNDEDIGESKIGATFIFNPKKREI